MVTLYACALEPTSRVRTHLNRIAHHIRSSFKFTVRTAMIHIVSPSSHGSISNSISMLRDHTPRGDRYCGVDTDVFACSDLLSGMYH